MSSSLDFNPGNLFKSLSVIGLLGAVALPFYENKKADEKKLRFPSVVQNALVASSAMFGMLTAMYGTTAGYKTRFVATLGLGAATMIPSILTVTKAYSIYAPTNLPAKDQ